jgi:ankyrin repeat protein
MCNALDSYRNMNLHSVSLGLGDLQAELAARPERVNEKGYSGMTPLMFACWGSSLDKAQFLLQQGASVNTRNNAEATALHYACRGGNLEMIKLVISAGADVHIVDRTGLSPLTEAVKRGKLDVAALLMEHGAGQSVNGFFHKSRTTKSVMTYFSKDSEKQFLQADMPDIGDVSEAGFSRAQ